MKLSQTLCLLLAVTLLAGCAVSAPEAIPDAEEPLSGAPAPAPEVSLPDDPAPLPAPEPAPEPASGTWPVRGVTELALEDYLYGRLLRLDENGLPLADESTLTKNLAVRYLDKTGAPCPDWTAGGSLEIVLTLWDSADAPAVETALREGLTSGAIGLAVNGLGSWLTGVPQGDALYREATDILEAGRNYRWELDKQTWTRACQQTFWELVEQQGLVFAESIRDHVLTRYLTDGTAAWLAPGLTAAQIGADPALAWAFTLRVWGYGEGLVENGALVGFADAYGNRYTLAGEDHPGALEFFDLMMRRYQDDVRLLEDSEGVGTALVRPALDAYVRAFGDAAPVEGISGLTVREDAVILSLPEPDDGALAALCIPVAGTAGAWTLLEQGTDFALLADTVGEKLELRLCEDLTAALLAGAITEGRIGTPDRETLAALEAAGFSWTALESDSLGWAGISPSVYPNRKTRLAIAALMDPTLAAEYWPAGTAQAAGWPVCGWLAQGETIRVFDSEAARQRFAEAGYSFSGDTMTDPAGNRAVFLFNLPTEQHPARAVFDRAAAVLTGWGADARVVVEPDLVALARRGEAGIWALAWDCAGDPEYLAGRYDPAGHTAAVHALGLHLLADTDAGEDLSGLVQTAAQALLPEQRRAAWQSAFEALEDLAVQVPLYRRGDVWVYR